MENNGKNGYSIQGLVAKEKGTVAKGYIHICIYNMHSGTPFTINTCTTIVQTFFDVGPRKFLMWLLVP